MTKKGTTRSANERRLIREGLRRRNAKGLRAGNPPFGYETDMLGNVRKSKGEQKTIRRVKTLYRRGETLRGIVEILAEEGYEGRTGNPLGLTQVARIAKSE